MKNQQVYILFDSYKGKSMATVYRREPSQSGSGFVVNYTATTAKQSWANFNAKRSKEIQSVYHSGHYFMSEAQRRNTYLLIFGGLSVALLSMTTGGITLYFGGMGKAATVFLATFFLGFTGVAINCESED